MSVRNVLQRMALGNVSSPKRVVVIGGSTGAVEALLRIVQELHEGSRAAVFVVVHIGANKSTLPWLLSRAGGLPAVHPRSGDFVEADKIYVAPPDYHMTLDAGRIILTRGPRENWARPAIDPLFRSAARAYGEAVIGVVLTGGLNDGTAGLFEIKARGGMTVVQDPLDALCAEMPQSALTHVEIDRVATSASLGAIIAGLLTRPERAEVSSMLSSPQEKEMASEFRLDRPVAITCPDCGGALRQSDVGSLARFTCHIGHAYTADVMLAAQFVAMEQFIGNALRAMNERAELCRFMSEKSQDEEQRRWISACEETLGGARVLTELLTREWLQPSKPATHDV